MWRFCFNVFTSAHKDPAPAYTQHVCLSSPLFQVAPTPRPFSRRRSPCSPVATASSISTAPSQAACSVPAACTRGGAWTVAAATAAGRWCASAPEGGGWFTGSRRGATPAGRSSRPVSTPKSLPSACGFGKWLDARTEKPNGHRWCPCNKPRHMTSVWHFLSIRQQMFLVRRWTTKCFGLINQWSVLQLTLWCRSQSNLFVEKKKDFIFVCICFMSAALI